MYVMGNNPSLQRSVVLFSACSSPYYSYLVHVYALAHVHVEELYKDSKSFFNVVFNTVLFVLYVVTLFSLGFIDHRRFFISSSLTCAAGL